MTAFREHGRLVVVVPAAMTARQRRDLIPPLVERFLAREDTAAAPRGEEALTERARALYERHLQPAVGGPVPPIGVRWVGNQQRRWGSCSPETGEIRLSDRLRTMPAWVVDYVLVHEAAHLVERHHTARFRQLEARYPEAGRARAFLEGVEFARGWDASPG